MGVRYTAVSSTRLLNIIIIIVTIFFANISFAQPKSRLAHCLTAAHEANKEIFKDEGKYTDSEEKLRSKLSEGCKALPYDITLKADKGFRVVSEFNNETWSVDENGDFVRAAKLTPRKPPVDPNAPPAPAMQRVPIVVGPSTSPELKSKGKVDPTPPPPPTAAENPPPPPKPPKVEAAKIIPSAVLASDSTPPLVQVPQFVPNVNLLATNVVRRGDDNVTRLERCFTRRLYHTKACTELFTGLDAQCGQGGDKVPTMCLELSRHIAATNLDDCLPTGPGAEENFGKCELKSRQMKKVCANPLKEFTLECRGLTKYLTRTAPGAQPEGKTESAAAASDKAVPVGQVPPSLAAPPVLRTPANIPELNPPPAEAVSKAGFYTSERTSINAIRNVQSLDSSLRKLLKLRPVSFESRETLQKEVGFVAEEVELIDPLYVNYSDNKIHSVKMPQLQALITGSIQEIYGMCRSDSDLQKDLIRRLVTLEGENSELKREVERQTRELIIIKAKLGLK